MAEATDLRAVPDVVRELIARYALAPLPLDGTLYAATYRSPLESTAGEPVGTAMIGLYSHVPESRSLFHRLRHDEVWHHYGGDSIRLVLLHADGIIEERRLGSPALGFDPQTVIPAGTWQAGELDPNGEWALFGCTVAPGFTPDCFEAGTRIDLAAQYPGAAADIARLTPPSNGGKGPNSDGSTPHEAREPGIPEVGMTEVRMPDLPPARTPHEAREHAALLGQLRAQRRHVAAAASALSDEQMAARPLASGWSATALLQHLTLDVERWWFRRVLLGEDVDVAGPFGRAWAVHGTTGIAPPSPELSPAPLSPDLDPAPLSPRVALENYLLETAHIDTVIDALSLDAPLAWWPTELMGPPFMHTLRDLVLHVTTETACHAGHLDVVRELLTGQQWLVLD